MKVWAGPGFKLASPGSAVGIAKWPCLELWKEQTKLMFGGNYLSGQASMMLCFFFFPSLAI